MNNFAKWTLAGTLAVLSACNNQPQQQAGGVALLDISLVSEKTGNTQQINSALQAMQTSLQADLAKLQVRLHERISGLKKEFDLTTPTDEQKQEMAQMINQAQQEYNQAQENAARSMKQEQARLVEDFRKKIQPLAKRAASKKKLGTVLLNIESIILVSDPSVDITSDVIELMKKELPAPGEAKAPEPAAETNPVTNPVTKSGAESEATMKMDKTITEETEKVTNKVTTAVEETMVKENSVESTTTEKAE